MSEVIAKFTLNCVEIKIQCKSNEKIRHLSKICNKMKKDLNAYIYIYAGENLNFDLTFEEHLQIKGNKEMAILVFKNEDYEIICTKCEEKMKLNKDKIDEIILNNNIIKDKISGIELMIDNMIKSSLINTMNNQLKNINILLDNIIDDIQKNNVRLENLLDNIIIK